KQVENLEEPGAEVHNWLLRSRSGNPSPGVMAASLLEALSEQQDRGQGKEGQCRELTIGTFSPVGMTGVDLPNHSLKILDALDINLSVQLAWFEPPNAIKDITDFEPRDDVRVDVGISFRGFNF